MPITLLRGGFDVNLSMHIAFLGGATEGTLASLSLMLAANDNSAIMQQWSSNCGGRGFVQGGQEGGTGRATKIMHSFSSYFSFSRERPS